MSSVKNSYHKTKSVLKFEPLKSVDVKNLPYQQLADSFFSLPFLELLLTCLFSWTLPMTYEVMALAGTLGVFF